MGSFYWTTVSASAATYYNNYGGSWDGKNMNENPLELDARQLGILKELVQDNKLIHAIKQLREWIPIRLVEAKEYVYNLRDLLYNGSEKTDMPVASSYSDMVSILVNQYDIDKDDKRMWEIIDFVYDTGLDEGEVRGYKQRLEEERG